MDIFYYHVYGGVEYLKQCLLSLVTLRHIGNCNCDVIIFTENVDLVQHYLKLLNLSSNTQVRLFTHSRPLFGRYVCALNLIDESNYRFITYLDNDIIINKDLKDYLRFPRGEQFFIKEETKVPKGLHGYFEYITPPMGQGKPLLANSGLFTFLANDRNKFIFSTILERSTHYPTQHYKAYGDQPIFATVLKEHTYNQEHLADHERLINSFRTNLSVVKTFTHYNVGHMVRGKFEELLKLASRVPKTFECSKLIQQIKDIDCDI